MADPKDTLNITILAQKNNAGSRTVKIDADRFDEAQNLIAIYKENLRQNQQSLQAVARRIEDIATSATDSPLAIWGGGRLFNSLVEHGALNLEKIAAVADTHLAKLAGEVRGARLIAPDALPGIDPRTIVVMSRAFFAEISKEADALVPGASLISYEDLMRDERRKLAAAG